MPTYTNNYNLHKISINDAPPDITVLNENWDTLDEKTKEIEDKTIAHDKLVRNKVLFNNNADLVLTDNTEYRANSAITKITFTFPTNDFESWISFTTANTGALNLVFPTDVVFVGVVPALENSTYYEISVKDKAVLMISGTTGESTLTGGEE